MARTIHIDLDTEGRISLTRSGYNEDPLTWESNHLYLPDFAGALATNEYINQLVAREYFDALCNLIRFILGDKTTSPDYWADFEFEFLEEPYGQAQEVRQK